MKYYISNKIKFSTFKKIMASFPIGDIIPMRIDRIVWELLKDKKLNVFIDSKAKPEEEVVFSVKSPKGKYKIIK